MNIKNHEPIVIRLKELIDQNPEIKTQLHNALISTENNSQWKNKTVSEMYNLLNQVVTKPLRSTSEIGGYLSFFDFVQTHGRTFFYRPEIMTWFIDFLELYQTYMNAPLSKEAQKNLLMQPEFQTGDFIIPDGGYFSSNDFFIRKLKPGKRPIKDETCDQVIISPNDGKIHLLEENTFKNGQITIKGDPLKIKTIFQGAPEAEIFISGPVLASYLYLDNYHHFHAPVSGTITFSKEFAGIWDDHPTWYQHTYEHRRAATIIKNDTVGYIGIVSIGFWLISSIELYQQAGDIVRKGDDLGHFALGGSCVLIFLPPNLVKIHNKIKKSPLSIKMGQEIAYAVDHKKT